MNGCWYYKDRGEWYYRWTYKNYSGRTGPFKTKQLAMEDYKTNVWARG